MYAVAEADRHHAGGILIWTLEDHQLGAIIRSGTRLFDERPEPTTGGTSASPSDP